MDIIASALSIHHLEYNEKLKLYKKIYDNLQKGKCFINLDQFCGDIPYLADAYDRWWYDYISKSGITEEAKDRWLERKVLDREISANQTIKILKEIGFEVVDCIYSFMKFRSILAIK